LWKLPEDIFPGDEGESEATPLMDVERRQKPQRPEDSHELKDLDWAISKRGR
jgi:hypothetical protein